MKLSGASGLASFSGTSGFQPVRSRPLNNGVTRVGTMASTWGEPGTDDGAMCEETDAPQVTAATIRSLRMTRNDT